MSSIDEVKALERVVSHLVSKFPSVDPQTVRAIVDEVYGTFDGPVRDYVPLLVQRVSTDRLRVVAATPASLHPHAQRKPVSA